LKKHNDVKYFHFREAHQAWLVATNRQKPSSDFKKNPYKGWSETALNNFIIELAPLASNRLIIGGWVPTLLYHQDKLAGVPGKDRHPYELCLDHLFGSFVDTIAKHKAPWKRQHVSFLFDHSDNEEWRNMIMKRFYSYQKNNRNFVEIGFRKKEDHTPLQAADMISYRMRHGMSKLANLDFSRTWLELDEILFKQIYDYYSGAGREEKERVFRKVFVVPENMTYEQALRSLKPTKPI
jgi:hypothetical protein